MSLRPTGTIAAVAPGTPAASLGLRPGDRLLGINGQPLWDQVDYRFLCASERLQLDLVRDGGSFRMSLEKDSDEELGLEFAEATFDGVRRCRNRCLFCFVDRMRPGLRSSLYVKDDDYRYSFLFGSYVTLTNLQEEDWRRLATQRLSPLYVSVHATDLVLRRTLLGNPAAPDLMDQLRRLAELHIDVHAQVVLCPGLNDGPRLERTVFDLATLAKSVRSVAVVPVGVTCFGPSNGIRPLTAAEMGSVVAQVRTWQKAFQRSVGRRFVHLADEFYLRSGSPVPSGRSYDGYPQFENGVGMTRVLLDEWGRVRRRLRLTNASRARLTLVCGELIAPHLVRIVDDLSAATGATMRVHVVTNRFFGSAITVSGLLAATDVVDALRGQPIGDLLVLPRAMFDSAGTRTLDESDVSAIQAELGVQVVTARSSGELVHWLSDSATGAVD